MHEVHRRRGEEPAHLSGGKQNLRETVLGEVVVVEGSAGRERRRGNTPKEREESRRRALPTSSVFLSILSTEEESPRLRRTRQDKTRVTAEENEELFPVLRTFTAWMK